MSGLAYIRLKFRPVTSRLKKIVHTSSHLAAYLPLMQENKDTKLRRLFYDPSDLHLTNKAARHEQYLQMIQNRNEVVNKKQQCMSPCEVKLILWYLLVFLAILYWFIETWIVIAFGEVAFQDELQSPGWLTVGYIFLLVLLLDIFFQFRVGFLSKGIIVKNKQRVTARYVNYPIIIDISVLVILFLALSTQVYVINYIKIVIILKFIRVFQMDRYVMRMLLVEYNLKVVYVILKQVVLIIVVSHTIGIFYYMLDSYLVTTSVCSSHLKFCWLYNAIAYTPVAQLDWQVQYVYTLYWGVNTVTNISYGDLAPQNPYETVYCLVCFVLSLVLIAYIINQIVRVILVNIHAKEDYREQLVTYTSFMDQLGINTDDQQTTKDLLYQRYINRESEVVDQELMYKLPVDIKNEYFQIAYSRVYHSLQFFLQGKADLVKIMSALKQVKYSADECLLIQGAPLDGLYYLSQGSVKLTCQLKDTQQVLTNIEAETSSFLYCYQFFTKDKASYTTTTQTKSLIYFIPKTIFDEISSKNQTTIQTLCLLSYELKYANRLDRVLERCLFCGYQHRWNECSLKFLDKEEIKKSLSAPLDQKNLGLRIINTKHRIWRDKSNLEKLKRMVDKNKDPVLMALERRILEIRKKVVSAREALQVDRVYEWSIYLNEFNISNLKNKYNCRKQSKMLI